MRSIHYWKLTIQNKNFFILIDGLTVGISKVAYARSFGVISFEMVHHIRPCFLFAQTKNIGLENGGKIPAGRFSSLYPCFSLNERINFIILVRGRNILLISQEVKSVKCFLKKFQTSI